MLNVSMATLVENCPREIVSVQRSCYSILALAVLFLSVSILIQVPAVQRKARDELHALKKKYLPSQFFSTPEPRQKFVTSGHVSDHSETGSPRSKGGRKNRRGGRKAKGGRIPPLGQTREEEEEEEEQEQDLPPADEIREELYGPEDSLSTSETFINPDDHPHRDLPTHERTPSAFETGIRNFNIKKAAGSDARPFGLTVEREGDREERQGKTAPEGASEGAKEGTTKDERKPIAIRLDLNLEIEIFLKAKIKGEVTITFLE
ncbi:hypothetical protein BP6252_06857 [Coleophoma cylindrospora]|uniref:Uncharacterized protein n=1 Tax=Coleophoma cylindrospora TaxID=1849047 RepID=A0A3D8RG62_9HELO|nr:hypothetical protein BP6252_06857 [Coleophoma cylindrospora]